MLIRSNMQLCLGQECLNMNKNTKMVCKRPIKEHGERGETYSVQN